MHFKVDGKSVNFIKIFYICGMPHFIDTHCHLDSTIKKLGLTDLEELRLTRFKEGLKYCVHVSCDPHSIERATGYLKHDWVYGAFGIHPHDAKFYDDALEQKLLIAHQHPKALAWGEMGLDYHYLYSPIEAQKEAFGRQIRTALPLGKPLVIHTREADDDTWELMKEYIPSTTAMHVHCFTSSHKLAENLLSYFPNLYIGFTGVITFKKTEILREVVKDVPLNRLLLETDSPYLAPEPYRGQVCDSGMIPFIAEEVAKIKMIDSTNVYQQILENSEALYGFSKVRS